MAWASAAVFALVFLAEFGDKTQLALVAMAARSRPLPTLAGAMAGFAVSTALAVTAGRLLVEFVPASVLAALAGGLFLVFAALALRPAEGGDEPARGGWLAAFLAIVVGELGDKTQLATAALAARYGGWATATGAFLALASSAALAIWAGSRLRARMRPRSVQLSAAALFAAVGLAMLLSA